MVELCVDPSMNLDHEVAFSLALKRHALRLLTLDDEKGSESLVGGSLGPVEQVEVVDSTLLEIRCNRGSLRLTLPENYLARFETTSLTQGDR